MADSGQLPEIKGRLTLDDTQVADVMAKVGKQAETMGQQVADSGDKGGFALKGFKFATKELAHEFGLGGGMARSLASEVEMMGGKMGMIGGVIGGVSIVVMAGIAIYKHFSDQIKQNREEIIKNSQSAESWIKSTYGAQLQTDEMSRATARLTEAERILNENRLRRGIGEEGRILTEQQENLKKLTGTYAIYNEQIETAERQGSIMLPLMEKIQKKRSDELTDMQNDIRVRSAKIGVMREELGVAGKSAAGSSAFGPGASEYASYLKQQGALELEQLKAGNADKYTLYAVGWSNRLDVLRASKATEYQINYEYDMMQAQQQAAGNAAMLQNDKNYEQAKLQTIQYAESAALAFMGKNRKAAFLLQKAFVIGNIAIQTALAAEGAAAAVAWIPGAGPELAVAASARMWTLGKINMALAAAAAIGEMATGSPGGEGAMPSYNANPYTGLPESGGQVAPSIYISIDGGKTYNKVQIAGDVLQTIYDNNGSVDGLSVSVSRSA